MHPTVSAEAGKVSKETEKLDLSSEHLETFEVLAENSTVPANVLAEHARTLG